MLRVLFAGSRWLGARVLEELCARRDLEVSGAYVAGRGWEGTDMEAVCDRLGVLVHTAENLSVLLANGRADLVVSCCTSRIFTAAEIGRAELGIVNLHPAPLPWYRGCNSYNWSVWNGDRVYGATLHYVDERIDAGPVIAREWVPVEPGDTARSLYDRAQPAAANLFARKLPEIVEWGLRGRRVPDVSAQDESEARYYSRGSLEELRGLAPVGEERERLRRALTFPPFQEAA